MIGPDFNPDARFCQYLIITTRSRKGISKFECDCESKQLSIDCANNEKSCPMQTEMLKKLLGLPNEINENNSFIGDTFPIVNELCKYLCTVVRPAKGMTDFICVCSEETCSGCEKDGICPIATEMREKLEEISKKMKEELPSKA
jgi:hypothetical protein